MSQYIKFDIFKRLANNSSQINIYIYIYILLLFYTPVYNTELMPLLEGLIQINDILNCRDMNQPLWVLE